jgi:hypothetical protein
MGWRRWKWQTVAVLTVAGCAAGAAGAAQFTSFSDRTHVGLEGNWQSCREADGQYGERIYDGKLPGLGAFEFHMGPYHEFALFRGVQDDHRDHRSSDNLLKPFTVPVVGTEARQRWETAGVRVDVVLAGGSREDCESWFVSLRPIDTSTSH